MEAVESCSMQSGLRWEQKGAVTISPCPPFLPQDCQNHGCSKAVAKRLEWPLKTIGHAMYCLFFPLWWTRVCFILIWAVFSVFWKLELKHFKHIISLLYVLTIHALPLWGTISLWYACCFQSSYIYCTWKALLSMAGLINQILFVESLYFIFQIFPMTLKTILEPVVIKLSLGVSPAQESMSPL